MIIFTYYTYFLLRNLLSSLWNEKHSKTSIHLAKLREGTYIRNIKKYISFTEFIYSWRTLDLSLWSQFNNSLVAQIQDGADEGEGHDEDESPH